MIRRTASKNYKQNQGNFFDIDGVRDVYMGTYIDTFMLGPITGTDMNFASKYIIKIQNVQKEDYTVQGLNANVY